MHIVRTISFEYSVSLPPLINNCYNTGVVITLEMSAKFKRIPFINEVLPQPPYLVVWTAETTVTAEDVILCTIDWTSVGHQV